MRSLLIPVTIVALAACTTTETVTGPNGTAEYVVACGAVVDWSVCTKRAQELCPQGYSMLSHEAGFQRKEMRIACGPAGRPS